MQENDFRHLLHLRRIPIGLLAVFCLLPLLGQAQWNQTDHDTKKYYFGITLAYNQAHFHVDQSSYFLKQDTVLGVQPTYSSGFDLGLLGNLRLNNRFDLRINPSLIFAEKNLQYLVNQDSSKSNVYQNIESVIVSLPLQVKFKSDRINDFRVYAIAGMKMDYDLSSNSRAKRGENLIMIHSLDWGYEAGIGFEFYLPSFIFSPEIKISNGLGNLLIGNHGFVYSNVVQRLTSRMVILSIHLEG
ncbi:MAG TPA: outer membrane beta-barrel protein [Chitinophagaceae bacterium]|nr:outer membrane beta-barrel protein [Chitinophagaceae bacterium]